MSTETKAILLGFVLPPLIVLVCMIASWRPWATLRYELSETDEGVRDPKHRLPRGWWGGAIGFGLAVIVGHFGAVNSFDFPPVNSYDWRLVAAVAIAAFALLIALVRIPIWAVLPLRLLISAGAVTGIAWRRFVKEQWEVGEGTLRIAAFALVITLFWTMLELIAAKLRGATPVIIAAGLCLATMPLLTFDAMYQSSGKGAAILATALLPAIVLAWLRKPISIARGGASAIALMLGVMWADAVVWQGGVNAWQGAAFVLAPLGALAWIAPWVRDCGPRLRSLLTIGAVALLPTIVVLETISRVNWKEYGIDLPQLRGGHNEPDVEDDYDYNDYYNEMYGQSMSSGSLINPPKPPHPSDRS